MATPVLPLAVRRFLVGQLDGLEISSLTAQTMGALDDFLRRSGELQARAKHLQRSLDTASPSIGSADLASMVEETAALLGDVQLKLATGEQLISAIFDGSLDGFALTDDNYHFVELNPAAAGLFGMPKSKLLGRAGSDFAVPGYDATATRKKLESAGQLMAEFPLRRPDGETRFIEFSVRANILPGLNFSVMRDVTERHRLEEQLWSSPGCVDIPGSMISNRGVTDGKTQATQVYPAVQG